MLVLKQKMYLIPAVIVLLFGFGCTCPQPEIVSITPSSGPGGTIVEIEFTGGGLSGVAVFEGSEVKTHNANSTGLGKKIRFTIPFGSSTGNKNVQVKSAGETSPAVSFNVTGPGTVPTPVIEGFEIGTRDGNEITVFGTGFSTLSQVFINNVEVNTYSGGSLPFREIPFDLADNVIVTSPAANLTLGTTYNVQVRNPNGVNSAVFSVTVPNRVLKMEFDAIENIALPDYYVFQNNTVNTIRRSYAASGWIIELSYDDTGITDPHPGTAWSYADLYSFWQANADVPGSDDYMHGTFIGTGPGGLLGVMYMNTSNVSSLPAANNRQGFAVFSDQFAGFADRTEKYLRTTIHEAGHGFHLYHSDGTGNQTVMNQTGSLVAGWHCFFSTGSTTHLNSHNLNDVAPGGTAWGDRTCH
jgi:hypothetical protein